jgi:hypothetical protein
MFKLQDKHKFNVVYKPTVPYLQNDTILSSTISESVKNNLAYISKGKKQKQKQYSNEQFQHIINGISNERRHWQQDQYALVYFKFTNKIFKYLELFILNNIIQSFKINNKTKTIFARKHVTKKYLVITPIKLYLLIKLHEILQPIYRKSSYYDHKPLLASVIETFLNSKSYINVFDVIKFLHIINLKYDQSEILFNYELKPSILNIDLSGIVDIDYIPNFTQIISIINDTTCRNRIQYLMNVNPFYNLNEIEKFRKSFNYKYCTKDIKSYKISNILDVTKHAPTLRDNNSGQNSRDAQQKLYQNLEIQNANLSTNTNKTKQNKYNIKMKHLTKTNINTGNNSSNNNIKYIKPRSEKHRFNTTPTLGEEQLKKSESESLYGDYGFIDLLLMEKM